MSNSDDDSSAKNYEDSDEEGMDMYGSTPFLFDNAKARNGLAMMIIIDGNPFSYIQTPAFKNLMRVACPPTLVLPSEEGIIKECFDVYAKESGKLMRYFSESKPRVSLSVDIWRSRKGLPYMRVTAHYVDNNWKLQKKILSFVSVDDDCKGGEITDMIETCLREWGIDKVFVVTLDGESARCDVVRSLLEALNKREAVRYFKIHPEKLKEFKRCVDVEKIEFEKLMNLDIPRQWNSTYLMLDTAEKYESAFKRYVREDDEIVGKTISWENPKGVPKEADWVNVRRLVKFLKPFYDLTLKVSESVSPTIDLYLPMISEADYLLQKWERDEDLEVNSFAKKMRGIFQKYWGDPSKMNVNIFIAAVLDPRVKFDFVQFLLISMYGESKGKELGDKVKRECYKLFEEHKRFAPPTEKEVCIGHGEGYMAQRRHGFMTHKAEIGGSSEKSEFDKYLTEVDVEYDDDFDILNWWKLNSQRFPILASMARDVLAVPVSTIVLESGFSTCGRSLDESRSSLEPKLAEALVCAQSWLRKKPDPVSIEGDVSTWDKLEELESML